MFKKLLNPQAQGYNFIQPTVEMADCCGTTLEKCKFTFSTDFAAPVTDVTIDGAVITFPTAASTAAALKTELYGAILGAGYIEQEGEGVAIKHTESAGVYTFSIYMDGVVGAFSGGAVTKACTAVGVCDYQSLQAAGAVSLTINGNTYTVGTYATVDAANAAQFKSDLEALTEVMSAVVSVNAVSGQFFVSITSKYAPVGYTKCADTCRADFE